MHTDEETQHAAAPLAEAPLAEAPLAKGESERLAAILEGISDACFAVDADWRLTYVNGAAERFWGRPRAALLGRVFWEAFPQAVGSENGRALERAMRERTFIEWEARSPVHGTWLQVRAHSAADGGLSVFFQNVEARKRVEAERDLFRAATERSNDAQYLIDAGGCLLWANRLAHEWLGYTPDELRALSVGDLNPRVPTAAFGAYFERALRGRVSPFESEHRRKDGSTFPVEITPTVVELPGGPRMLAAVRDITERKAAEAERARLLAEAQAGSRAKSEFLATMSHEFRTPLNAILGYAQLLDMGVLGATTPAQHAHLERLQASARHLLQLVDDVLDVAKVDADRLQVRRDRLATGAAVAAALALVQPQATAKGVHIEDQGVAGPGVAYVGDEHRVRQVLVNLLANAVKFTPAGGTVTVSCGVAAEPGFAPPGDGARPGAEWRAWAFVRVADTGPGIAPALRGRLFEPFTQGDGALTRQHGGTGLGLAISRRLARLMGGDLVLEDAPGGAVFALWLPAPDEALASLQPPAAPAAGETLPRRTPTGMSAVVAAGTAGGQEPLSAAAYAVLHALGVRLAADAETVAERYVAALRAEEAHEANGRFPGAHELPAVQLRDHATPQVGLLATRLMTVGETRGRAPELLADGSEIQRVMAELHGGQRHRLGWTEADIERETALLTTEVERALDGALRPVGDAPTEADDPTGIDAAAVAAAAAYAKDVARYLLTGMARTAVRAYHAAQGAAGR